MTEPMTAPDLPQELPARVQQPIAGRRRIATDHAGTDHGALAGAAQLAIEMCKACARAGTPSANVVRA